MADERSETFDEKLKKLYVKAGNNEEAVVSHALRKGLIVIKAMRGMSKLICSQGFKLRNFHP